MGITANSTGELLNNLLSGNDFINNDIWVYLNGNPDLNSIYGNLFDGNGTWIEWYGVDNTVDYNTFDNNTNVGYTWTNATGNNFPISIAEPDTCNNFGKCDCYGTIIADGAICSNGTVDDDVTTEWLVTCPDTNSCPDPDGCTCFGTGYVTDGDTCSDGNITDITTEGSVTCTDPDGCTCFAAGTYNDGDTFTCNDWNTTTITNGATCTDPDGCSCGGSEIADGATCTISSSGGGGGGGSSSSSKDNCPYGDNSGSYYDNSCWATNSSTSLGAEVDDDLYADYSYVERMQILVDGYTATETTLRHGEFFALIIKFINRDNMTDMAVDSLITTLVNAFSGISEATFTKYGFDKTLLLEELLWIIQ